MARQTKKQTAKKATAKISMLAKSAAKPTTGKQTRRPPNNPDVPEATINELNSALNEIKTALDDYSAHLRALDRQRLNGVGIHKLGFIERSYECPKAKGFWARSLRLSSIVPQTPYINYYPATPDSTRQKHFSQHCQYFLNTTAA